MSWLVAAGFIASSAAADATASTQARQEAIRLFLDCQRGCDSTFLRRELEFVVTVRDPADADVHLLITRRSSAGGNEYLLGFHGRGAFESLDQQLKYNVPHAETDHQRRAGMARLIKLGLVPYVMQSPYADGLEVAWAPPASTGVAAQAGATREKDPWNYWVFSSELGTEIDSQERRSEDEYWGSFWASRTTEAWRMGFGTDHRLRDRDFEFDDGTTFSDITRRSNVSAYAIKTLGDHWGAGGGLRAQRSTFRNLERGYRVAGAIEYNLFPYSESSLRALQMGYFLGATQLNYDELTVFGLLSETRTDHGAFIDYKVEQPWGEASLELTASQFLEDSDLYRITLRGEFEHRLTRGLSIRLWGRASLVRDQIYLPAGGTSDADVLLGRRALDTGFETRIGLSLRYRFGSIYNSTVNERLRGRGFTSIF